LDQVRTPFVKPPGQSPAQFDYLRTAHRFEGGNPNFLGVRVLRAGAEFLLSIGLQSIENRVRELTTACLKQLRMSGLETRTREAWDERAHIVSVLVPNPAALMARLREKHRVVVNVKYDALRDFDPITVVAETPYLLVVNPGLPFAGNL